MSDFSSLLPDALQGTRRIQIEAFLLKIRSGGSKDPKTLGSIRASIKLKKRQLKAPHSTSSETSNSQ